MQQWLIARMAAVTGSILFYNASAFRSAAYLMYCLHARFLGNKCSDEHICFIMYCIIEEEKKKKNVWWTKQLDVSPLNESSVYGREQKHKRHLLLLFISA
jgi:hypothetical protein